jgi:hypothetical protein
MFEPELSKTAENCSAVGEAAVIEFDNKQWETVKNHLAEADLSKDLKTIESHIKRTTKICQ